MILFAVQVSFCHIFTQNTDPRSCYFISKPAGKSRESKVPHNDEIKLDKAVEPLMKRKRQNIAHVNNEEITVCPYCNVSILHNLIISFSCSAKITIYYPSWLFLLPTESQRGSRGKCRERWKRYNVFFTITLRPVMHQIHIKAKCDYKTETAVQVRVFCTGFWWQTIINVNLNVFNICAVAEMLTVLLTVKKHNLNLSLGALLEVTVACWDTISSQFTLIWIRMGHSIISVPFAV